MIKETVEKDDRDKRERWSGGQDFVVLKCLSVLIISLVKSSTRKNKTLGAVSKFLRGGVGV